MELKYNFGWELDGKIEMIHVKIKYWKIICKKKKISKISVLDRWVIIVY